jgi:type IV pilus assembly protein PilM
MSTNTTTLYIDNLNMRLMITRGKRIIKLADMPLDTSLSEIDTPEKEKQLEDKIKHFFASNKISSRKIILGISGLHCLTRPIVLPELPKAMLEEAVTREARRVLPVPVEQLYISWQLISVGQDKIQAFMVGITRHITDMVIKIVSRAGFKPYSMDIKPLALARLSREEKAVILDVQPSEFDIIVLMKGVPQPIRTVPFPRETPSLKERMVIVKDELQRTIQFYNSTNGENKIQPGDTLLVSGEVADETELYESLGQQLNLKATPLVSPLKCLKQLDPSHHLVNVGLTLKEMVKEAGSFSPNINVLPIPYQPKQISINRLMAVPATAIAIGLLILLGMNVREAAANLESVHNELSANQAALDKRTAQKKDLTNKIAAAESNLAGIDASMKSYTAALKSITGTGKKMNEDLNTTLENIVSDMDFENLTMTGDSITLGGKAVSEQEVFEYVRKLSNTGRYKEITIANLTIDETLTEDELPKFSYTLNMKLKANTK